MEDKTYTRLGLEEVLRTSKPNDLILGISMEIGFFECCLYFVQENSVLNFSQSRVFSYNQLAINYIETLSKILNATICNVKLK